ncbi:hypothetical protein LWC34_49775 [Kibdelosporangium philippinense]|uniref:Uncharacterized protein n=1 Tax=Kibdelosporangium philippinense TaxID=211113 RepID=A0ABS8ZXW2_9PSEU|nr:DUF6766 family protein [Kibdelosporangium philippinense]MCE7010842.1 hypothetical protein [Kibdelosporangium philippinense]
MNRVTRYVRHNGLSLFFGALFLLALAGQAIAGFADHNDRMIADHAATVSFLSYVTSADFAVDVAENWQSEYLQFFLYIIVTVWLVQVGSPESKHPRDIGQETDKQQLVGSHSTADSPKWTRHGGWRTAVFSWSLGLAMLGLFLLSWLAQSVAGLSAYNSEQLGNLQDPVGYGYYVTSADFWNRTLQNWQSEFLAIGSMAVFSVYLRQRGSPESKPVGAPHATTEQSG